MKLEQLQHLLAIVEHGSLRAAAKRLHLLQPALTRSIRTLERELGGPVFVREPTGMTLTAMGERLHLRAVTIVNEATRARDEVAQLIGDDAGTVVAGLSIMPHVGMLPQAMAAFRQRYPKVLLQLIEGLLPDIEAGLRNSTVDFYLGAAPHQPLAPGLAIRHLFDNTRVVVCRKNHPLAKSASLMDLAKAEWATTSVEYKAEEDLQRLFESVGMPAPRIALKTRSALSLVMGVANSDLLAMLPVQWESSLLADALQVIHVRESIPAPAIVLVKRRDLPLTPAAEFLCDVLLRQAPCTQAG